jgi:hypothetical protein
VVAANCATGLSSSAVLYAANPVQEHVQCAGDQQATSWLHPTVSEQIQQHQQQQSYLNLNLHLHHQISYTVGIDF